MQFNNNQPMTIMGTATPKPVIFKSESHKLHQAFPVKSGEVILQGMPVKIETDGSISPYYGTGTFIGIAVTNSEYPAYKTGDGIEVTVAVEGYMVVSGVASAAVNAGPVLPEELGTDSMYVTYKADTAAENPKFIALTPATSEGELIHVLVR